MKDGEEFIQTKQTNWALRNGVKITNHSTLPGVEKHYTTTVDENLYVPLSNVARSSFEAADGKELNRKMLALASSSALAVNLFAYWIEIRKIATIGELLGLPSPDKLSTIQFESIHPILAGSETAPNLDAEFVYDPQSEHKRVFLECKFVEPYRDPTKAIKEKYFRSDAFNDLPHVRAAAERTLNRETRPKRFNASQAITHILGIKRSCGTASDFTLLYLWYDAPGHQAVLHEQEMSHFAGLVAKDGIDFRPIRHNELLVKLAKLRQQHPAYIDYITGRYL